MERELEWIAELTGAQVARRGERIQTLWGGYGELFRVRLLGAECESVVAKWVKPPANAARASRSDARKRRSYEVEVAWYQGFAPRCDASCRVPKLIGAIECGSRRLLVPSASASPCEDDSERSRSGDAEWLLVLEDLDLAGFTGRRHRATGLELGRCLAWLAAFHARFLDVPPEGLWSTGTYWHLATRPDELATMGDDALRDAAPELDARLARARFQTLVHGDAKEANFCFSRDGVAAVDFQYVGRSCGMRDVAYLLSGRSDDEARDLDLYFAHLRRALARSGRPADGEALEAEWRALYPIACADYCRFLAGWAKAHWQRDLDGQRRVRDVLRCLASEGMPT